MEKTRAKFDTTYCINKKCDRKCFRHESNYIFKNNENYCWADSCMEFLEREYKNEV